MSKAIKYAKNAAIFAGLINAAFNTIKQLNKIESNPDFKFNWKELLFAAGKGAVFGGIAGYGIGTIADIRNENEKPINTDAFLYSIIDEVKLTKTDPQYQKLEKIAFQVSELISKNFGARLRYPPIQKGSTKSGVALKEKFDIDIYLLFKPKAFGSTKKMYDEVFNFLLPLEGKYSIRIVRAQKKSIGLIIEINGIEQKIDIVPSKLTQGKEKQTVGYLHVNKEGFLYDESSYTKTDLRSQDSIKLSKTQENIIIILKNWKHKYELPLSSHLLKNLVLCAYSYNRNRIPKAFTKKVIMTLRYIAENLDAAIIRSIENTNNVLTNIPEESKQQIISACIKTIEDYQYQPNSIVDTLQ